MKVETGGDIVSSKKQKQLLEKDQNMAHLVHVGTFLFSCFQTCQMEKMKVNMRLKLSFSDITALLNLLNASSPFKMRGVGQGRGLVNDLWGTIGHSQEVVRSASSHMRLAAAGGGVKLQAVERG